MTDEKKPRYELRRRGKTSYVALWQGKHCLCAICTKTVRGALDAQLILLALNSHKDLLTACGAMIELTDRLNSKPAGSKSVSDQNDIRLAKAAIASTKPEQEAAK